MNLLRKIVASAIIIGLSCSPAFADKTLVKKLADNVYMVSMMHYASLVVVGDKDVLITDTANEYRASLLRDEIAKITDKPVGKLVLTHEHFDHTDGTEVFAEADIIAQQNAKSVIGLDPLDLFPDEIDITFDKKMAIDMGTTTVELLYFGSADGAAAIVVYLPKEKIALTADLYLERELHRGILMSDTNLLGKRDTLNAMVSWNLKHAINAHLETTDPALLVDAASFMNDLYGAVLPRVEKMLENPKNLIGDIVEMGDTLKLPKYKNWKNYSELPEYVRQMAFALVHGG